MSLWCKLWGHRVIVNRYADSVSLVCPRCHRYLALLPIDGWMPVPSRRLSSFERVTIGPLRRFVELYRCHFLGHDDQWLLEETRDLWYLRCATCYRELDEPRIIGELGVGGLVHP